MSGHAWLVVEDITITMGAEAHNELQFVIDENRRFNDGVLVVGRDEHGDDAQIWVGPYTEYDLQLVKLDPSIPPRVPEARRLMLEDQLYDTRRADRTAIALVDTENLVLDSE